MHSIPNYIEMLPSVIQQLSHCYLGLCVGVIDFRHPPISQNVCFLMFMPIDYILFVNLMV